MSIAAALPKTPCFTGSSEKICGLSRRSLTEPIVRKTLEPLIRCLGEEPTADQLLELKICDPALGSGAFLVECCRQLADDVVAAWGRAREVEGIAADCPEGDAVAHGRTHSNHRVGDFQPHAWPFRNDGLNSRQTLYQTSKHGQTTLPEDAGGVFSAWRNGSQA